MEIKIKYFNEDMPRLELIDGKSDWIDLRSAERYEYKNGQFLKINLGVAMQLPEGYEAHVAPRGSTFKNYGILQTNSVGVVDESYCGDNDCWFYPCYAVKDGIIEKNDRICQFRIVEKMPKIIFEEVLKLNNEDRSGFGSSGVK